MRADLPFDAAQVYPMTSVDYEYSRRLLWPPVGIQVETRLVILNSHRINRGNYVVKELAEACHANEVTDLVVLHETRSVPDALIVSHFPHGPIVFFTLQNASLRYDLPAASTSTVSEQYPHLIFEVFESKRGLRIRDVLKNLFPVPKEESTRFMSFVNDNNFISFRHHVFVKTGRKEVRLAEVGPRFEMKPYKICLGTIEQEEADKEWVLIHYTRTAKKRRML